MHTIIHLGLPCCMGGHTPLPLLDAFHMWKPFTFSLPPSLRLTVWVKQSESQSRENGMAIDENVERSFDPLPSHPILDAPLEQSSTFFGDWHAGSYSHQC